MSLTGQLLETLAEHPDGLLRVDLIRLLGSPDGRRVDNVIKAMLRAGYVQRVEPARRPLIVWQITGTGRERLARGGFRAMRGSFTHGTTAGYNQYGCRCELCKARDHQDYLDWRARHPEAAGRSAEYSRRWRAANPDGAKRLRDAGHRHTRALNAELREAADRHGEEWTAADLEMASRRDMTTAEVAARLGRSLRSVSNMRQELNSADPRNWMLRDGPTPPTSRS